MAYTSQEISEALVRAQRAMLIISDRIQSQFYNFYSKEYKTLKYIQYDIYILYKTLIDEFEYTPYTSDYYTLVGVLISKCQEVDAFNNTYETINGNYQNIAVTKSVVTIVRGLTEAEVLALIEAVLGTPTTETFIYNSAVHTGQVFTLSDDVTTTEWVTVRGVQRDKDIHYTITDGNKLTILTPATVLANGDRVSIRYLYGGLGSLSESTPTFSDDSFDI